MNNMMKEQEDQGLEYENAYLDSNLFIYATLDEGNIGESARKVINIIKNGNFLTYTSVLTIDEVLWKTQKVLGREKAAEISNDFLNLNNLQLISVDLQIMREAIINYTKEKLAPRDSIHLACMNKKKLNFIISSDPDFDKVKDIKRIDFTKVKYIQSDENGNKK